MPASWPDFQGRLPELDLPAHAVTRGKWRRDLRYCDDPRRRRLDPSGRAALDQLLCRAIRLCSNAGTGAGDSSAQADTRSLLRRVRGESFAGHDGPPGPGRFCPELRGGNGVSPRCAGATGAGFIESSLRAGGAHRRLRKWPAAVPPGMLAGVCAHFQKLDGWTRLCGDAGVVSSQLGLRAATANALGDGYRTARLAAVWVGGETWGSVLAVAGPKRVNRKSTEPGGESGVRL